MILEIKGQSKACKLTEEGIWQIKDYIKNLKAKRKGILDAKIDTANETPIPTLQDIVTDIEEEFSEEQMEYRNMWGATDKYDADEPLHLKFGKDITYEG